MRGCKRLILGTLTNCDNCTIKYYTMIRFRRGTGSRCRRWSSAVWRSRPVWGRCCCRKHSTSRCQRRYTTARCLASKSMSSSNAHTNHSDATTWHERVHCTWQLPEKQHVVFFNSARTSVRTFLFTTLHEQDSYIITSLHCWVSLGIFTKKQWDVVSATERRRGQLRASAHNVTDTAQACSCFFVAWKTCTTIHTCTASKHF